METIDNIIDFNKYHKAKLDKVIKSDYYSKLEECSNNIKTTGKCTCKMCLQKLEWANSLIYNSQMMVTDYMQATGEKVTFGDLLEVYIIATLKLKEICTQEV